MPSQKGHNELLRNQSRFKILSALSEHERLSWSQLRKVTGLSKNTTSNRLSDLRKVGLILETVERSGDRGRPRIVYRIDETRRKQIRKELDPVTRIHEIERDYVTLTTNYVNSNPSGSVNQMKPKVDWIDILGKTSLAMLETVILQNKTDPSDSSIIIPETIAAIGRILTSSLSLAELSLQKRSKIKKELEKNRIRVTDLTMKYSEAPSISRKNGK